MTCIFPVIVFKIYGMPANNVTSTVACNVKIGLVFSATISRISDRTEKLLIIIIMYTMA